MLKYYMFMYCENIETANKKNDVRSLHAKENLLFATVYNILFSWNCMHEIHILYFL